MCKYVTLRNVILDENEGYAIYVNNGVANLNNVEVITPDNAGDTGINNSIFVYSNNAVLNIAINNYLSNPFAPAHFVKIYYVTATI